VINVGSPVIAVVQRVVVKRGDTVVAGQLLLTLRSDVERANVGAAQVRAGIDAEALAATAGVELAKQKERRAESLAAQNFVSAQAVELARSELEVARQKLNQALGQQNILAQERHVAEAQLALRTVNSPVAGVVIERFVEPGERIEVGPLFRLAVIDPLRVELMVPSAQYGTMSVGDRITVRPDLPGFSPVLATVRHVDKVFDAASNSFRVQLTIPNPNYRLPAGLRCKVDLTAASSARSPTDELKLTSELTWPPHNPPSRRPL
jgi:RND family efflux transporter MFP subunit